VGSKANTCQIITSFTNQGSSNVEGVPNMKKSMNSSDNRLIIRKDECHFGEFYRFCELRGGSNASRVSF
jgi:hypothetical protein